jgi:hypothetical protein
VYDERHGPSRTVNCSDSPAVASGSLAPIGTARSAPRYTETAAPCMLVTSTTAWHNQSGSNSGGRSGCASRAATAVSNRVTSFTSGTGAVASRPGCGWELSSKLFMISALRSRPRGGGRGAGSPRVVAPQPTVASLMTRAAMSRSLRLDREDMSVRSAKASSALHRSLLMMMPLACSIWAREAMACLICATSS